MKFHAIVLFAFILLFCGLTTASAQVDSVVGQITSSASESFANGISGDGRFVVFESVGNIATENPRNADGNREIFLFDYAQRRIFQITNTTALRINTANPFSEANTRVLITNVRPVISNDGRWIAFGSNATIAFPGNPTAQPPQAPIVSTSNPGNFNAESFTVSGNNSLTNDANTEMWLYQIPATPSADLSSGAETAFTDLSAGTFVQVTNTLPSRLPAPYVAGTATTPPTLAIIGDDNRDASINDNGNYIAFVSNRDLVAGGNASPNANDEIFTYVRNAAAIRQITTTPRGTAFDPIYNQTPTISGNGLRLVFGSTADKPITGITQSNTDRNVEVFVADLDASGAPSAAPNAIRRQITVTTRTNPGDLLNVIDFGRRMSRDGRYIAFDSYADLANENGGTNYTSYALYLFDLNVAPTGAFRRVGPRSDADTAASGGDIARYPGFTDTDANGTPATLVFETRANITANGTVATTNDGGLNPNASRPAQIYSYPLTAPPATAVFTRLTRFPTPNTFIASTQPLTSNSLRRMAFNLALTELGTGNFDLASEAFYFLLPQVTEQRVAGLSYATGASRLPVSASPVPTPSPTATPTPGPSPTPTPTPQTPPAVLGVSPGMLVLLDYNTNISQPLVPQTAVGSIQRRFQLPIELGGVTMTINGAAVGLKSVSQRQIVFVVPPAIASNVTGTAYPVVINNNGIVFKGSITIVPVRPDVFTFAPIPAPNGRARVFNITNTVFRTEPFNVTTLRIRGGRRVPTVLRLFLTGINTVPANLLVIRIGSVTLSGEQVLTGAVEREPGIYSIDFTLPPTLQGAGDVPVIVSVTAGGVTFSSRLDDTAPRFTIL